MANVDNFHILKGMALYFLELDKGGVREPHWHPNASELGYCLAGKALMTIFSPGASHDTFTVDPGEIVFVPKGYLCIILRISAKARLNLPLLLTMRDLKILVYLVHWAQYLTMSSILRL